MADTYEFDNGMGRYNAAETVLTNNRANSIFEALLYHSPFQGPWCLMSIKNKEFIVCEVLIMDIKNSIPMIFLEEQKKNCPKFFDSLEKNMKDSNPWRKEGCYLPITTAIRAVMRTRGETDIRRVLPQESSLGLVLATLSSWRKAKSIYTLDYDLFWELMEQSKDKFKVSSDMIHLPTWCIYIDLRNCVDIEGVFVSFDWTPMDKYLVVTMVTTDGKAIVMQNPMYLRLPKTPEDLDTIIEEAYPETVFKKQFGEYSGLAYKDVLTNKKQLMRCIINFLLYISAVNADVVFKNKDTYKERAKITDKPSEVKVFAVGENDGVRLKEFHKTRVVYKKNEATIGHHASPAMHIRRAHWHTYLYGKGKTIRRLKWQAPIIVKNNGEEINVVTLTVVKKDD